MKLIRQGLERGMFMTFGEKVRSLRKEKKMSQQELASMVGVSYRTIRSWEVEGRFPKQNVLYQKLADALQCDVSYLMSEIFFRCKFLCTSFGIQIKALDLIHKSYFIFVCQ